MHRGPPGTCLLSLSTVTSCFKILTMVLTPLDITVMGMEIISLGTSPSLSLFSATVLGNHGYLCPFLPHFRFFGTFIWPFCFVGTFFPHLRYLGTVIFTLGFLSTTFLGNFGIFRSVVVAFFETSESLRSILASPIIFISLARLMALVLLKLSWIELGIVKEMTTITRTTWCFDDSIVFGAF